MRCLAKLPADRWQRADELKTQFDSLATPPSGGVTPTGTQPVAAVPSGAAGPVGLAAMTPVKVAVLFGAGAAFVLVLVYMLMTVLGLPSWVFVGAIALLAVGLPIMLVTGRHEQQRAVAATTGMHVTTPVGVRKHFTWRRATLGGGLAFAGQARLVLADFENATSDSTLGETVAELFRIDLNESPAITLLSTGQVANVLARMERPEDSPLTPGVASEIAIREGIKAYLTGDIRSLGESYLLAARLRHHGSRGPDVHSFPRANRRVVLIVARGSSARAFHDVVAGSAAALRPGDSCE
jgi:hypothetical protein